MKKILFPVLIGMSALLSACGGGGGSNVDSSYSKTIIQNGVTYEFRVTISGSPRRSRGSRNSTVTETFIKTRKFDETEFESFTGTSPANYGYIKFKRSYWLANSDTNPDPCALWRY